MATLICLFGHLRYMGDIIIRYFSYFLIIPLAYYQGVYSFCHCPFICSCVMPFVNFYVKVLC